MIAYIDSSVFLRVLLNQKGKLPEFKKITRPVSSLLLKAECLRTLDRLRLHGHLEEKAFLEAAEEFHSGCLSIEFIRITQNVLSRASAPMPTALGTLDAIHLSSALIWSERMGENLVVLTHDLQLGKAAQLMGLRVLGIDAAI